MEDSTQSEIEPQSTPAIDTTTPPPEKKNLFRYFSKYPILFTEVMILILVVTSSYIFLKSDVNKPPPPLPTPTPTPIPSPTPTPDLYTEAYRSATANWKTYRNEKLNIQLKYPIEYTVTEETSSSVTIAKDKLGTGGFKIVNNKSKDFIKLISLKTCKTVYEELKSSPSIPRPSCIEEGAKFGQNEDIVQLKLGGIDAKSFYLTSTGRRGTAYVVQTTNNPIIQVYFFNANDPDVIYYQILSTFKFTD